MANGDRAIADKVAENLMGRLLGATKEQAVGGSSTDDTVGANGEGAAPAVDCVDGATTTVLLPMSMSTAWESAGKPEGTLATYLEKLFWANCRSSDDH